MTTEHMHHEHSDVDTSVVEYPSALKTTTNPTINEAATSIEAHGEVGIPSPEPTVPAPISEKDQETAVPSEVSSDLTHGTNASLE